MPALEHLPGELVVLSAYGGADNYFHWMFEVLPRLGILRRAGKLIAPGAKVLVSGTGFYFQAETLAQLGDVELIDARTHAFVSADTLIVPSLPGIMGDVTGASCQYLRDTFGSDRASASRRRLFVSRAGASYRRMRNEADVVALLAPLGFEVVRPETMSVREQAEVFGAAAVVIAPHGAGLTNLVFCRPGTTVIELFSPSYVNGCYWALANQLGLDYWYQLGAGRRPEEDATHAGAADDYDIDLDAFRVLLRKCEGRKLTKGANSLRALTH